LSVSPEATPACDGDPPERLFAVVYDQLKIMARQRLARVPRAALETTELVHELFLRIGNDPALRFDAPAQFFAYAARAMRHLLLDRARDCMRQRAGGDWTRVTLNGDEMQLAIASAEEALAIEAALEQLARAQPRAAEVLELRYFAGLSVDRTAEVLGMAPRSVDRDWRFARAFLHERLSRSS
jgi:RNA polymerase sigma factor (TIGR02999 family)